MIKKRRTKGQAITLDIKKPRSRYAALHMGRGKCEVLAEGVKLGTVIRKAKKTGKPFSMITLLDPGKTYTFKAGKAYAR